MNPHKGLRLPSRIGSGQQKSLTSLTTERGTPVSGAASSPLFLWIRFFGRFEVSCGNRVLPLPANMKALAILRYLLTSPGNPISRDFLMDWLWPESDFLRARYSVNSAICVLRKLLSSATSTLAPTDCILLEQDYYRLSPNIRVASDKDEFYARYKRGRELERAQRASEAVTEYDEAIELYKGEFLIEDLYEEWPLIERQRLGAVYVDILERVATYHWVNRSYRESIEACYKILAKEPGQESSHRRLMECYVQLGLRALALRQYGVCEKVLRRRYGIAPSPETKTLYNHL